MSNKITVWLTLKEEPYVDATDLYENAQYADCSVEVDPEFYREYVRVTEANSEMQDRLQVMRQEAMFKKAVYGDGETSH